MARKNNHSGQTERYCLSQMKLFFISLVILGLLFSCAVLHQEKNENIFPDTLQTILEIHPEYVPHKCRFSPKDISGFFW